MVIGERVYMALLGNTINDISRNGVDGILNLYLGKHTVKCLKISLVYLY